MTERRLTITAQQRDLLYDRLLLRLSGIDDVWIAVENGRLEEAERLGREFSDELRILDDLGWGEHQGDGPVELRTPPEVVRRVVKRIAARAEAEHADEQKERVAIEEAEEERRLVREACEHVLVHFTEDAA